VDLGLALPQFGYSVPGSDHADWETTSAWARRAEDLGFGSVWLADHLFLSIEKYGGAPTRHDALEPIATLAALSRTTDRVRLGTLVLCGPFRPPAVLAKQLAGLDRMSGGRLIAGLGAGWYEDEFAAAEIPFAAPGRRLEDLADTIDIVRAVLTADGPVSFEGRHASVAAARVNPGATQRPAPPLWVGGRGDRLLALAATHADGWNTVWSMTPAAYRSRLEVLDVACERVGRDPETLQRSLGLTTIVGEDEADVRRRYDRFRALAPPGTAPDVDLAEWRQGRLVGTVDDVQEQLGEWAELGVTTVIANLGAVPFAVTDVDDLDMVATALPKE
jgi:probable F420-dependent oxidoreductase